MDISKLYMSAPCAGCPMRKDTLKGWLGFDRMTEIMNQRSFVCHKNKTRQCAGHMIIRRDENDFYQLAVRLSLMNPDQLKNNKGIIFESPADCIAHHARPDRKHDRDLFGDQVEPIDTRPRAKRRNLADGNPMVKRVGPGPPGKRCKHCHFHYTKGRSKTYHKCEFQGDTAGPGTDIRANWPACSKFEPKISKS